MNKEEKENLLSPEGKKSSMRYVMLRIIKLVEIMSVTMMVVLIYQVLDSKTPDWQGAAMFLGAIGVVLGMAMGTKAYQKKSEV